MSFKTLLSITATTAALAIAAPALAEEDWDSDGDGKYSREEFDAGVKLKGDFAAMDANGDRSVDEGEYNDARFTQYDRDGSGDIDEVEREDVDRDYEEED
ncbi:hypothetical protein [Sulfitobacter sp. S190]|uniref:hypothetical protein n=1 Tax=Sulfitobacter sp. S190 TaxID=2867022 RepID=UPI0021A70EF6|nr:hypothetical protein [Sulfitobacter sp. S190]UWR20944.1 hypothetical protein K3756_09400 [Sulfitobacter sp. S190]